MAASTQNTAAPASIITPPHAFTALQHCQGNTIRYVPTTHEAPLIHAAQTAFMQHKLLKLQQQHPPSNARHQLRAHAHYTYVCVVFMYSDTTMLYKCTVLQCTVGNSACQSASHPQHTHHHISRHYQPRLQATTLNQFT